MSREEPNVQFNLPDTPTLADRLHGWALALTVGAALTLIVGIAFVISALHPGAPERTAAAEPYCPAPTKGQRVEIVIRNDGRGLIATCRPLIPGGIK